MGKVVRDEDQSREAKSFLHEYVSNSSMVCSCRRQNIEAFKTTTDYKIILEQTYSISEDNESGFGV